MRLAQNQELRTCAGGRKLGRSTRGYRTTSQVAGEIVELGVGQTGEIAAQQDVAEAVDHAVVLEDQVKGVAGWETVKRQEPICL